MSNKGFPISACRPWTSTRRGPSTRTCWASSPSSPTRCGHPGRRPPAACVLRRRARPAAGLHGGGPTCRASRPTMTPASTAASACPPPSITSPSRRARRAGLAAKRDQLRAKGLEVTDIVDHGWAKSIYFSDPNGLSLEIAVWSATSPRMTRRMQERGTIPLARLDFRTGPASISPACHRRAAR